MSFTILTASAGSGKTYRITGDLSAKLSGKTDSVLPEQIIATTFTVAAAADLQAKTRERLLDDAAQGSQTAQVAREIGSALIGTIHSVAGQIVSEYAIDAGLSPRLRVLGQDEQERVFNAAVDSVITLAVARNRALLARTSFDAQASAAGNSSRGFRPTAGGADWGAVVNKICGFVRENRMDSADLENFATASWAEYKTCLPEPKATDRRSAWEGSFRMHLQELQDRIRPFKDLEGDEQKAVAKAQGVDGRSVKSVIDKERALRDAFSAVERDRNGIAWNYWYKLGTLGFGRASKKVDGIFEGTTEMITSELPANPVFQDDVEQLIRLTFATARHALAEYADYKRELGVMDFVDQQVLALELLETKPRVRESIASRFSVLAVDEFQDTSPIQLELFLRLAKLVGDVTWVGDPKQAIYRFRGADPELMDAVMAAAQDENSPLGTADTDQLGYSWRSSAAPIQLSNTVFGALFEEMDAKNILLEIPEERRDKAGLGSAQAWFAHLEPDENGKNRKPNRGHVATAIAAGIADLMEQDLDGKPLTPADIAVLAYSRADVDRVVAALEERGIQASGGAKSLLAGREGQLLMAGLRAVVTPDDTLALTELVELLPDHAAHDSWFEDLAAITGIADDQEVDDSDSTLRIARRARQQHIQAWWDDPALAGLYLLADIAPGLSPQALVDGVIEALDLHGRAKGWTRYEERLASLDGFRALAVTCADQGQQTGQFVGPQGLVRFLAEQAPEYEPSARANAVTVTTIHGSKGLEWPVVITALSEKAERRGRPDCFVRGADRVNLEDPLAGRTIYFLPAVLGNGSDLEQALTNGEGPAEDTGGSDLDGGVPATRLIADERAAEKREKGRVNYVALTRAKYINVMVPLTGNDKHVLNEISPSGRLMEWHGRGEAGSYLRVETKAYRAQVLSDRAELGEPEEAPDGNAAVCLPMELRYLPGELPADFVPPQPPRSPLVAEDASDSAAVERAAVAGAASPAHHVPARFTASHVESTGYHGQVSIVAQLGAPLVQGGGEHWDQVGEAVHAYLATPHRALEAAARRAMAERLIATWGVERYVSAEQLVEVGRRWSAWVDETLPGGVEQTEVPIAWANDAGQVMEGWIDSLVEMPGGGHVLVDHKTYPGKDPIGHIRETYLGQMTTYSAALADVTGHAPDQVFIHLPLLGQVAKVEVHRTSGLKENGVSNWKEPS